MSRRKFDINSENVKIVLSVLKSVGGLALVLLAPNAVRLFAPKRNREYDKLALRRSAYYLKRRGDIRFSKRNGETYIALTQQGVTRLTQLENVQLIRPAEQQEWDGKWRIVIFDIPEKERLLRDAFRRKLRELGCKLLQGSVWITPFDIREEIDRMRRAAKFNSISVQCILADTFDEEAKYRKSFKLPLRKKG